MNLDFLNESFSKQKGLFDEVLGSNDSTPDQGITTPQITNSSSGSEKTKKAHSSGSRGAFSTNAFSVQHFLSNNAGSNTESHQMNNNNSKYEVDALFDDQELKVQAP